MLVRPQLRSEQSHQAGSLPELPVPDVFHEHQQITGMHCHNQLFKQWIKEVAQTMD